jgi:hypothetical protein
MRGAVRFLRKYERQIWPIPLLALMAKCTILSLRRGNRISLNRIPNLINGMMSGLREMSNASPSTSIREVAENA